ncbi:MAG: M56 family metallopeptidase, partial [Planctomycetaceae bacterium]
MFDISVQWLVTALDASIKAGLIALVAALVLRLLRVGDSNVRHRVWTGVLLGMLALPALSQVMPALRLPFAIDLGWLVTRWEREQSAEIAAAEAATGSVTEPEPVAASPEVLMADVESPLQAPGLAAGEIDHLGPMADEFSPQPNGYEPAGYSPWGSEHFASFSTEPIPSAEAMTTPETDLETSVERADQAIEPPSVPATPVAGGLERFLARWPQWLFVLWGTGAALLMFRLLMSLASGRWLLSRATPISAEELEDLGLSPQLISTLSGSISLLECDRLRVPVTIGLTRSRILLPLDWVEWPTDKLTAVLTHERTHVERRDCAVMFLAELNRCVAWFHPLAWWLKRHLSSLAEAACDDAVIDSIGDRATYARHLLEVASVASRHRGRVLTTGVSMARRSNVENRIHSILDSRRPLTQRLTRATALLLVSVIIPVIALAAALQPAGEEVSTVDSVAGVELLETSTEGEPLVALAVDDETDAADDATPFAAQPEVSEADEEIGPIIVRGIVTDTDEKPIVDAKVWLAFERSDADKCYVLGRSQADGRFELTLPDEAATWLRSAAKVYAVTLLAQAEGYAVDRMPLWAFDVKGLSNPPWTEHPDEVDRAFGEGRMASQSLRLSPLAQPTRGTLLSIEGRPLAGVQVRIEDLYDVDMAALDQALENKSNEQTLAAIGKAEFSGRYSTRSTLEHFFPVVATDDRGQFEFPGIGRDQVAVVTLLGEHVAAERLFLVGRDRPTASIPHLSSYPKGAQDPYCGTEFTHVVSPGIPIVGVVKEHRSGKPIADAEVFVERLFGNEDLRKLDSNLRLHTRHIRTRTDADGRYRLLGVPP